MKSIKLRPCHSIPIAIWLCLSASIGTLCNAKGSRTIVLAESPSVTPDEIRFLDTPPVIDGILDPNLSDLSARRFTRISLVEYDGDIPEASYRMAYGTHFLYVYIEVGADALIFRDRAYQHGDGFHMVLAMPRPGNQPTDEFYVLACSAVDEPRMEWSRRIFWYYNVNDIFRHTSDDVALQFRDGDGTISFELLLPWPDVHPYHPWISESIGFNLRFVKATDPEGKIRYDVVHDDCIDCELSPRSYALLTFEAPTSASEPQTFVLVSRGNISEGDSLEATAVTVTNAVGEESVRIRILTGEGEAVQSERATYEIQPGLTKYRFKIDTRSLPSGGYKLLWQSTTNESDGDAGLTVLRQFDRRALLASVKKASSNLSASSSLTMEFLLDEIAAQIDSAKPYETCPQQRLGLYRLERYIEEAAKGVDSYANRTGFIRKAYRSDIDSSLQPYMLWIPEDYSPNEAYPLLVYLHGSASTEHSLGSARRFIPEGFIALAPRGRGTSNCFTFDHAQEDIAEAIDAVVGDYLIDAKRIILCGFSMGGYGVYRTHFETPGKFSGLAVFSGSPDLASRWYPREGFLDFMDKDLLGPFRDVPIFVFHGEQDLNAPCESSKEFAELLKQAGARVDFHSEADKGHEAPSDSIFEAYYEWVRAVIRKPGVR